MAILTIVRDLPAHVSDAINMLRNPEKPLLEFKRKPKKLDYCVSSFFLVMTFLTILFSIIGKFTNIKIFEFDSFYIGERDLYINGRLDSVDFSEPRPNIPEGKWFLKT